MLYHNALKYYAKSLLNRKNDAWYFDRMIKAYNSKPHTQYDEMLRWAKGMASLKEMYESGTENEPHPLYETGMQLSQQLMQQFEGKYISHGIKVLIHTPPASYSPGGFSWFSNLAVSFTHLGVTVIPFWDHPAEKDMEDASLLLTSCNKEYTQKLDWDIIKEHKKHRLKVFSSCNVLEKNALAASAEIEKLHATGIDHFFSFFSAGYISNTVFNKAAISSGSLLIPIEFAANPLYHYPAPVLKRSADYIFLGSANYDKARRYHDYFYPVIKKHTGVIAGPGWPWSSGYSFNQSLDRWLYCQASVGLNLHIDAQVNEPIELNERTYILAACGIPQVIDNPLLLSKYFPTIGYSATTPREYADAVKYVLGHYDEAMQIAEVAMKEVYNRHTTFHRLDRFLEESLTVNAAGK